MSHGSRLNTVASHTRTCTCIIVQAPSLRSVHCGLWFLSTGNCRSQPPRRTLADRLIIVPGSYKFLEDLAELQKSDQRGWARGAWCWCYALAIFTYHTVLLIFHQSSSSSWFPEKSTTRFVQATSALRSCHQASCCDTDYLMLPIPRLRKLLLVSAGNSRLSQNSLCRPTRDKGRL